MVGLLWTSAIGGARELPPLPPPHAAHWQAINISKTFVFVLFFRHVRL